METTQLNRNYINKKVFIYLQNNIIKTGILISSDDNKIELKEDNNEYLIFHFSEIKKIELYENINKENNNEKIKLCKIKNNFPIKNIIKFFGIFIIILGLFILFCGIVNLLYILLLC